VTKTLYVGNLPWKTKAEDLKDFFSAYTQVEGSRVIRDKETGRSKGFGFVEIPDEDVARIIEQLNGAEIEGRKIIVNEAKERE
jgi:RNA recognition motif-containing protein